MANRWIGIVSAVRDVTYEITALNGVGAGNAVFVPRPNMLTHANILAKKEMALYICLEERHLSVSIIQRKTLSC